MNRAELLKNMTENEISGTSALHMRSESIQKGNYVSRIPSLKKGLKKKSKLLLICELAIPFHPETGETGEYNKDNKWRPPFAASSVAKVLKGNANENEKLKEMFMRRAGITTWDTSNCDEINDTDVKVFMPYRVPRVFTVPVVSVSIPAMTGSNGFSKDFAIDVKYDDKTGQIIGEKPGALKVNDLFRDIEYEEIAEMEEKLRIGELHLTDEQKRDKRQEIRNKTCVSGVHPANYVTLVEIPMTAKLDLSADFLANSINKDLIESSVVISRYTKKMQTEMSEYISGNYEKFDHSLNYVELDMSCPTEGDESTSAGKQAIGQATTFSKPATKLTEESCYADLTTAIEEYLDSCSDIEERVYRSIYVSPYNEEVENQIYTSLRTVLDIENNKYVSKKVLQKNAEVITLAFGEKGEDLLLEVKAGVSEKSDGLLADPETVNKETSTYDLSSDEFVGDIEEVETN